MTDLTPAHMSKQAFGKRLRNLMLERGWSARDMLDRADVKRDAISKYTRGVSLPSPAVVRRLAGAFGIEPEQLLPNETEDAIRADHPSFAMQVSPSNPAVAWLHVDRLVSTKVAVQIAELLSDDNPTDRLGSGGGSTM